MRQVSPRGGESADRPPWSPILVTALAFLLPPGGAILTVWNLHRLGELDRPTAVRALIALVAVLSVGFVVLAIASLRAGGAGGGIDANASTIISVGIAAASYLAQRRPYRTWRASHARTRTSSLLAGIGYAVLATVAWLIPVSIVLAIAQAVSGGKLL